MKFSSFIFLVASTFVSPALSKKSKSHSPNLVFYTGADGVGLVSDSIVYQDKELTSRVGVISSVCTATGGNLISIQCQTSVLFDDDFYSEMDGAPTALTHQGITDFNRGLAIVTGGTGRLQGVTGHGFATVSGNIRKFEYWLE